MRSKPPPEPVIRTILTMPESLKAEVDQYRADKRIGSVAEAMRRLLQAGLDAEVKRAAGRGTRKGTKG